MSGPAEAVVERTRAERIGTACALWADGGLVAAGGAADLYCRGRGAANIAPHCLDGSNITGEI